MEIETSERLSTGVLGLDEVLQGGLIPRQTYLVRGGPGTGKTTLGLHFLTTGATNGEKVLLISLGEPEAQLRRSAAALGFDLQGVAFLDLSPDREFFEQAKAYHLFPPANADRETHTPKIVAQIEALRPARVFIDAISQFRFLAADEFQFRQQMLAFLRFLVAQGATVLFTSEGSVRIPDDDLQFLCDGIINLELTPKGRTLQVTKFRGSDFQSGAHSLSLKDRGMEVFPRLLPEAYWRKFEPETISFGVPGLDALLHGGLERGTVTLLTGPSGVGKTTLGLQFAKEAAARGERSVVYTFDEAAPFILRRCEAIRIPAQAMAERGMLSVVKVEPLQYTPDEFAHLVRWEVEQQEARIVMIDSVSGYRLSLQGEDLISHLHALCKYLQHMGVVVLLVNELEAVTGEFRITEVGLSYLADNIVFLRYLERHTATSVEMRKAIGVLKKRLTDFEKSLREFEITPDGLRVGEPLTGLSALLSGTPEWTD